MDFGNNNGMPYSSNGMDMMSMGNMDMDMGRVSPMHETFYWGREAIVLFDGWPGRNFGMYILSLFFIFFISLLVEVLSAEQTSKLCTSPGIGALTLTLVHAVRMGLAYMVMLAAMSFNLGIFIAAIVGHAFGFFLVKARSLASTDRIRSQASPATDSKA